MLQLIKQLLGSLLLVCLNISVLGQGGTVFRGKVVDIETLMPLQYATVVIEGSSIGVATNSEGDFMLNIPETYSSKLIKVSYVGYNPVYIEAKGVENTSQSIYLEALNIVLGDVIIKAKKSTAEKIISKAIWSIPDNYET